jgi:glycosyltransferase involved in cell wall biosynthesis
MSKARRPVISSQDRAEGAAKSTQPTSLEPWFSAASLWLPEYITESAWVEHSPFAFWLVEATSPRTLVELGTHSGFSYFSFCQAVDNLRLDTQCYAVDTWKGDEHAGFYDEDVFLRVRDHHARKYARFSQLIRSTFDEAAAHFPDGVVDLLHIDGRHFYDDVRHDFLTWKLKLSSRAIVVLHDINVRVGEFGVWKFWEEIKAQYPSFEFGHGHGLGVIACGTDIPEDVTALFGSSPPDKSLIRSFYSRLGGAISDRTSLMAHNEHFRSLNALLEARNSELAASQTKANITGGELTDIRQELLARDEQLRKAEVNVEELQAQIDTRSAELADVRQQLLVRVDTTSAELADVRQQLLVRDNRLRDAEASVEELQAKIDTTSAALADVRQRLLIRDGQIREAEANRQASVQKFRASIEVISNELTAVRQQLLVRDERLREAGNIEASLRLELSKLTEQSRAISEKASSAEQLALALQMSSWWRLTAPVRKAMVLLTPAQRNILRRIAKLAYWLLTPHRIPARVRFIRARERNRLLSETVADVPEVAKQADVVKSVEEPKALISALEAMIWPRGTAACDRDESRPIILMLFHKLGGGTELHVRKLAEKLAKRAQVILLKARSGSEINLSTLESEGSLDIQLGTEDWPKLLVQLRSLGVQRIHLHHTFGFFGHAKSLIAQIGLPYDLTIHDYMLVCPRLFMYREGLGYCGEPDEAGCMRCLRQNPPGLSADILWWRWRGRELIEGADRVICPSQDAAARIARYAPAAKLLVVPHEDQALFERRKARIPRLLPGQPMRVVVLGVMTGHKGIFFLIECIAAWKKVGLNVDVTLIGESMLPDAAEHMEITGPYEGKDLPDLIAGADPHLIFYPQRCPETYSYTLSEGLTAGVPLLAPDLGSFRERIAGREWCWSYDGASDPDGLAELMRRIRVEHIERKRPPPLVPQGLAHNGPDSFYEEDYFAPMLSVGAPRKSVGTL